MPFWHCTWIKYHVDSCEKHRIHLILRQFIQHKMTSVLMSQRDNYHRQGRVSNLSDRFMSNPLNNLLVSGIGICAWNGLSESDN